MIDSVLVDGDAQGAEVLDRDDYSVREELARIARIEPVGAEGFWSL
jgi:hypothetical protein